MNIKQRMKALSVSKSKVLKSCQKIPNKAGIYILTRIDEDEFKYAYIGQSKHMLNRLAEHMLGYQSIDFSIKKHGWYSLDNIYGWKIEYLLCEQEYLNDLERDYIKCYANLGYQLKNKTKGGQDTGKGGLENQKPARGYFDGVEMGRQKTIKAIKVYFEKYLDAVIKPHHTLTKEKKLKEFYCLLGLDKY